MQFNNMDGRIDRRGFLAGAGAFAGLASTSLAGGSVAPKDPGFNLVMLQLSGGNDGLSMVVPHADDIYHSLRPKTRHEASTVLRLDDYRGLHPGLRSLRSIWDDGKLAIVEGLGYANPLRSHFKSMDVWHTGHLDGRNSGPGWIGRLSASKWGLNAVPELAIHLGANTPYSVDSPTHPAISVESPTGYRWFADSAGVDAYAAAAELETATDEPHHRGRNRALAQIRGLLHNAQESSVSIRATSMRYTTSVAYPRTKLGASLRDAAAILQGGLGTRIISVELAGFDTHADQRGRHANLMETLDEALGAFLRDLERSEVGRRTVVMAFSEFGRRAHENGSRGTDHGKAGPALVLGPLVKGGLYGRHPSLSELDSQGDLAYTTDFRSVYGTILERGLGASQESVLGASYPLLRFLG